jgi:hypothetical protein
VSRMRGLDIRRITYLATAALTMAAFAAPVARADTPHFVPETITVTRTDDSLIVSGKEAGISGVDEVHITSVSTVGCINPAGKEKKRAGAAVGFGDFPVQDGEASFSLTLTAAFVKNGCRSADTLVWHVFLSDVTTGSEIDLGTF